MRKTFMFMVCAMAFGSVGCNKKPADGAGSGSAAGSATTAGSAVAPSNSGSATTTAATGSATGSGAGCASPTAYKSQAGGFCIETHGFTPKEDPATAYNVMVSFTKPIPGSQMKSSFVVSVSLQDVSHSAYDGMATGMADRSKDPAKVISKGDLTDVTGKFLVENVGKHVAESLQVIVKGKTHSYACGGENFMPTVDPDILAACKSIRPAE